MVNIDGVVKTTFRQFFVIPAKAVDSVDFDLVIFNMFWIPACSGMTEVETFYEIVNIDKLR